eukprot:g7526.t1
MENNLIAVLLDASAVGFQSLERYDIRAAAVNDVFSLRTELAGCCTPSLAGLFLDGGGVVEVWDAAFEEWVALSGASVAALRSAGRGKLRVLPHRSGDASEKLAPPAKRAPARASARVLPAARAHPRPPATATPPAPAPLSLRASRTSAADGSSGNGARADADAGTDGQDLSKRRAAEMVAIKKVDKQKLRRGESWFVVEAGWLRRWAAFVGGGDPPGALSNAALYADEPEPEPEHEPEPGSCEGGGGGGGGGGGEPRFRLRSDLRVAKDYRCVSPDVWALFEVMWPAAPRAAADGAGNGSGGGSGRGGGPSAPLARAPAAAPRGQLQFGAPLHPPIARWTKDVYAPALTHFEVEKVLKGPRLRARVKLREMKDSYMEWPGASDDDDDDGCACSCGAGCDSCCTCMIVLLRLLLHPESRGQPGLGRTARRKKPKRSQYAKVSTESGDKEGDEEGGDE